MKKLAVLVVIAVALLGCREKKEAVVAAEGKQKPAGRKEQARPSKEPVSAGDTSVGSMMPAYSAELLDGGRFEVASERGNVVFLNLWATWCGPCRYEIPELEDLHKKHAAEGFKVVGVSLDDSGRDAVKSFVTERKMTYPVALDPDGNLANILQTTVVPTSVLIDRDGKIVWKRYGMISASDETLVKALSAALAQQKS